MLLKSKVLIIAGSDSSGGAGIQADIKTVTSLGGYAMTAVTAITAQNTTGVKSVVPIDPKEIEKQILFTCKDINPDAIKIGMLHSQKVIISVIKSLKKIKTKKIILDPVMVAKGGTKLINRSAINILKKKLIKKAFLVTPNIPEIEILSKIKIKNINDMVEAARILMRLGVKNVLVKGGHTKSKFVEDVLLSKGQINIFRNKRIMTKNTHGTGCSLASSIATLLGRGFDIEAATSSSIKYVQNGIKKAPNFGQGNGPILHFDD